LPVNLPPYLLAFLAGAFYACSALLCKRGLELGAGTVRSLLFSNWIMALFFIPYPFIEGSIPTMNDVQSGVLLGSIFFLSQTACFFALEKGDASMVTPIMGAKSIFVAFFVLLLGLSGTPSQATWIAVTLAAVAVALIGWPAQGGKVSFMAIGLGLLTAAGFGLTDAMVPSLAQQSTPSHVVSIMFLTVGSASILLIPLVRGTFFKIRKKADIWMFASCIPMGIQAVLMSMAIAFYQVPAEANVFYACRGIWAVILASWIGTRIGLKEGEMNKPVRIRRLLGASLLILGIYFAPLN
jgi:drug/metabolite transporter (DMT)-like permease